MAVADDSGLTLPVRPISAAVAQSVTPTGPSNPKPLFRDANSMPGGAQRPAQPSDRIVARARPVELLSEASLALRASLAPDGAGAAGSFELALFDGTAITIVWQRSEPGPGGSVSWLGEVEGIPRSQVVLTLRGDIVQGNISWPGARYHLRYAGRAARRAIHALQEIDVSLNTPLVDQPSRRSRHRRRRLSVPTCQCSPAG